MEKEINIKKLLQVIKKRLWIVIVLAFFSAIAGGYYTYYVKTPLFEANTRILIRTDNELISALLVMLKEPSILEHVVSELNLSQSPEGLSGQISAYPVASSQVVVIRVVDTDSTRATEIANKTTEVFIREVPELMGFGNIEVLRSAKENVWPINLNHNRVIMMSLVFGIVVGIGLIFLLDSLDDTIRGLRETEELLGIPVLGYIPKMTKRNSYTQSVKQQTYNVRGESIGS